VTVFEMEIVVGTIKVGGHHGNVVGAVLQVVALAHLQAGYLGDGILLVGVFQRAGQEAVLLHRLQGVLGIDTGAAQEEQFLHAMGVSLTDDIALNLHVHHDEVCTIQRICHNTAYKGSSQYYSIRLFFIKELLDRILVCQVQLLVAPPNKVGVTTRL